MKCFCPDRRALADLGNVAIFLFTASAEFGNFALHKMTVAVKCFDVLQKCCCFLASRWCEKWAMFFPPFFFSFFFLLFCSWLTFCQSQWHEIRFTWTNNSDSRSWKCCKAPHDSTGMFSQCCKAKHDRNSRIWKCCKAQRNSKSKMFCCRVALPEYLQPRRQTIERWGPTVTRCRCQCTEASCTTKRAVKYWCAAHKKPVLQYDVFHQNHGKHGHRMWNRDVRGALIIGHRFLAMAWSRIWACGPGAPHMV